MKAKKGDPIKKGLKAKGDFYQSLEPEYKKIYMKHLDDAINRGVSVSDAASSAVFKVNKAKEEAKVAKKNIKNFVGDRKYKKGGKVDPPKKNKLVKKAGKDAYNKTKKQGLRPGTVSYESNEIASSRAKTQAQKNASEAYDNIMNFVGDRKYEKGGKVFKPHNMYKDGKKVVAKSMADHLRLKKQGYTHKK